jgi:HPt (histidine-containing phosphotransfer) domain-containing protein
MTANTMKGDRERCLAVGMDDYVAKPIDLRVLSDAIARWIIARPPAVPTAGGPNQASLLDRSMLDELCEGDPDMRHALVTMFSEQSLTTVSALGHAIRTGDGQGVKRDAHRLKGSSASVGALRMSALCDRLEDAGQRNAFDEASTLLAELERASELTRTSWSAAPV